MDFIKAMEIRKKILEKCDRYMSDHCSSCPLRIEQNDMIEPYYICGDYSLMEDNPEEYLRRITEWDKNHLTNLDMLKKLIKENFDTVQDEIYVGDINIAFTKDFAQKEYMPPKNK